MAPLVMPDLATFGFADDGAGQDDEMGTQFSVPSASLLPAGCETEKEKEKTEKESSASSDEDASSQAMCMRYHKLNRLC